MNKKFLLALLALAVISAAVPIYASTCYVPEYKESNLTDTDYKGSDALVFENKSGKDIKGIYFMPITKNEWSKNVVTAPIKDGETRNINIYRDSIITFCDVKIVYTSGPDLIWHRLPMMDIYNLGHTKMGRPDYQRASRGS